MAYRGFAPPSGFISNARGTSILGFVFLEGGHRRFSRAPRGAIANPPAVNGGDREREREASDAAILRSIRQRSRQIHNALALGNVDWAADILVTTIDVRDNRAHSYDGAVHLQGAIFDDNFAAFNAV